MAEERGVEERGLALYSDCYTLSSASPERSDVFSFVSLSLLVSVFQAYGLCLKLKRNKAILEVLLLRVG